MLTKCYRTCYDPLVKRLFLIILLTILPLQLSWAAAGAYCKHEQGVASNHFGHHVHQHQSKSDTPDSKGEFGKVHNDCKSCHGVGFALFMELPDLDVVEAGRTYVLPHPLSYRSHIPDGPRRPDRFPVA